MKGSTTEKEALAIVVAITKCHLYLHGKKFTIITDHRPLNWLLNAKEPTGKLIRWAMLLQSYDFDIQYSPGRLNRCADALFRREYSQTAIMTIDSKGGFDWI